MIDKSLCSHCCNSEHPGYFNLFEWTKFTSTKILHMTYQQFSAEPRLLPADGGECSVSVEPARALLHVLSDHTAVLLDETWQRAENECSHNNFIVSYHIFYSNNHMKHL